MLVPFAVMVLFCVLIGLCQRFFTRPKNMIATFVLAGALGYCLTTFSDSTRWNLLDDTIINHWVSLLLGGAVGLAISYKIAPEKHLLGFFFAKEGQP